MPGDADDSGVCRYVGDDDGAGADLGVLADRHITDDLGAGTHDDVVLQRRMPLGPPCARAAQRHALEEVAVVADDRRLADDDTHTVVDEEALADLGARMDLDAGKEAPNVRYQPRRHLQPLLVQGVGDAVQLPGVKTRVGEHDLEVVDGGGIAPARRLDVTLDAVQ